MVYRSVSHGTEITTSRESHTWTGGSERTDRHGLDDTNTCAPEGPARCSPPTCEDGGTPEPVLGPIAGFCEPRSATEMKGTQVATLVPAAGRRDVADKGERGTCRVGEAADRASGARRVILA